MVETFVIAEIGINHNGSVDVAKEMIRKASLYGADAVKFQTYKAEKRVSKNDNLFPLLKKCELTKEDCLELQRVSTSCNMMFFSTPFDEESVRLLRSMNVPLIKIASFDVTNLNFLRMIAETKISVIMSTGMANKMEISNAINIFKKNKVECSILHCVSSYPADIKNLNLRVIKTLKDTFSCSRVGYSDHSGKINVPSIAVAQGAEIIEIHFAINGDAPDISVSLFDKDFALAISQIRETECMLGSGELKLLDAEKDITMYRRFSK